MLVACSMIWAALCGVSALYSPCSAPSGAACGTDPKAPNRTFKYDRFIALHMMIERIKPLDPSSAPAVMSRLFSSTNPIATAARPA